MTGSFCVQVTLGPTELFCDSEFLKNILDFLDVLHHMSFQQQRVIQDIFEKFHILFSLL